MTIRFAVIFTFSMLTSCAIFGQSSEGTYYKAVGIDASFINDFLPFQNNVGSLDKHLIHFIKYKDNNKFIRHAFDIDIFGAFQNNDDNINRKDTQLGFNYKFSEGKTKDVFKNAKLHYGGECLVDYFFNRRRTEDPQDPTFDSVNINTDHDIDLAVGPFVGLGYKISERFSIYTEGGFYIDFSYSIDKFSSDFTPAADFTDSVFSFREVFDFPDSIVLFYNF